MNELNVPHIMSLDLDWVEPINERRGGWSGVSVFEWGTARYYLKRQKNHTYRDWRAGFRRVPTLRREVRNMHRLARIGIRSPEIIAYGEHGGDSILMTLALDDYYDLDTFLAESPDTDIRQQVFEALGGIILR
ncbi:MAG: hypothetical protein KDI36_18390, partial [Pseudomonadales bacterium]|nr:hypothetical protein [Pseudomonadales bacterium]